MSLPGSGLARQKFLEQKRRTADLACHIVLHQRRYLVAEAEQTTRLEAEHGHALLDIRKQRGQRSLRFRARLIDFADGQKSPAAAQRAAAVGRHRKMDLIASRAQHRDRRVEILALEIAIEGVGEEDDVAATTCRHARTRWVLGK